MILIVFGMTWAFIVGQKSHSKCQLFCFSSFLIPESRILNSEFRTARIINIWVKWFRCLICKAWTNEHLLTWKIWFRYIPMLPENVQGSLKTLSSSCSLNSIPWAAFFENSKLLFDIFATLWLLMIHVNVVSTIVRKIIPNRVE